MTKGSKVIRVNKQQRGSKGLKEPKAPMGVREHKVTRENKEIRVKKENRGRKENRDSKVSKEIMA